MPPLNVQLLQSGAEYFPALIDAINRAGREVRLETYIFSDDPTGGRVTEALAGAARRGLSVHLVVDGFGTGPLPDPIARTLNDAGVQVQVYAPMPRSIWPSRDRLRRLHRKLACIDGQTAFIGGINVLDDHWDPNHGELEHPRLDYAVQVGGSIAQTVQAEMQLLWAHLANRPLQRTVNAGLDQARALALRFRRRREGAYLALRDNLAHRREIERAYLQAIGQARNEVLIANAYFFPGRRFRRALREASRRGVKVQLLLQGRVEYILPHRAAQALYESLMASGIEVFEYHRSFLHAKVAVIDDWATVGSSNIDPFSLLLAREANLVIRDAGFAAELRDRIVHAIHEGGLPIAADEPRHRPLYQRAWGWLAYGLLRLGVLVSGERQRF